MSSEADPKGLALQQQLIELRISAHHGPVNGRAMAMQEYERLLKVAVKDHPFTSTHDLDVALLEPYLEALRKRDSH